MESRMRGNSHVRFGAGDEETCLGNGARRFIPTLPKRSAALFLLRATPQADNLEMHRGGGPNAEIRGSGLPYLRLLVRAASLLVTRDRAERPGAAYRGQLP